jgi:hypothetical protein
MLRFPRHRVVADSHVVQSLAFFTEDRCGGRAHPTVFAARDFGTVAAGPATKVVKGAHCWDRLSGLLLFLYLLSLLLTLGQTPGPHPPRPVPGGGKQIVRDFVREREPKPAKTSRK